MTNKRNQAPIMMRITIEGKRTNFSTNIEVEASQWDTSKQKVKGNSPLVKEYNETLLSLRTQAWDYYNEKLKLKMPITPDLIRDFIRRKDTPNCTLLLAINGHITDLKARIGNDVAPLTVKKYETIKRKVENYLKKRLNKDDILLSELSGKFIHDFDTFMRTEERLSHNCKIRLN